MAEYASMKPLTQEDYEEFTRHQRAVTIGKTSIEVGNKWDIESYGPPENYHYESETVWSFPNRGDWVTHTGKYRGNWSPYIPRNLIMEYTVPGETVVDQMCGSGTTLIECRLMGRNSIGVDVNRDALIITRDRLNFQYKLGNEKKSWIKTYIGDARNLDLIDDESVDLIATHPPYAGIIPYSGRQVAGDLSSLSLRDYVEAMRLVAEESLRILKGGRYCAILIGDTRRSTHYVPISHRVMEIFLEVGFILKEDIIKLQWKMKGTREKWRGKRHNFYKIAHEHLYVFRKANPSEPLSRVEYSMKWR
jgi:DNA modification methylase